MSKILATLRDEHANMSRLLDVLDDQIAVFGRGETPDYEAIRSILAYMIDYSDRYHHPKEDLIYHRLRERHPEAQSAVHDLSKEHDRLSEQTRRVDESMKTIAEGGELSRNAVMELAAGLTETLRRHLEIEEKTVFRDAERHLTDEDWAAIEAEAVEGDDPLFGPQAHDTYRRLKERVLDPAG